uniref:CCHC-type domain-containing protein n=1 Tax=Haemonchus contortus TaxID=6289 RepID=A0A7I5EAG2_HAECO
MAGPTSLKSAKALLTRYCNTLERIIKENEGIVNADPEIFCDSASSAKAQAVTLQLNSSANLVTEALNNFTMMCDSLDDALSGDQEQQVEEYVTRAHSVLELAQTTAIQLECKRTSVRDHAQMSPSFHRQSAPMREIGVAQMTLPPIPIPSFDGKVWEFQNFWTLFAANVHNQPLTKLQKFNYLLKVLQGEAREAVRRYPVTEENYDHAIELLRKKYGDETKFIACLQARLERARAENPTLPSQRRLLENIIPIVTQLTEKGVPLDGSFLVQKILSKFSVDLQRKVLKRRLEPSSDESAWVLQNALADLDEIISVEERINDMVHTNSNGNVSFIRESKRIKLTPMGGASCIFCASEDHKSVFCKKFNTLEERRTVFREHNRCLNCAIVGHFVKECPKDGCKTCSGKKHHHTLCPQRCQTARGAAVQPPRDKRAHAATQPTSPTAQQSSRTNQRSAPQKKGKSAQSHLIETAHCADKATVVCEKENDSTTVLSAMEKEVVSGKESKKSQNLGTDVFLLTGVARVRDSVQKVWKDVEVLLDTGADQSFISQGLADELGLVCKAQKTFVMYTFGTETPRQTTCGETMLDLWDHEGDKHELRLYTTPVLTAKSKTAQLCSVDLEYIARHKIFLSRDKCESSLKPQILLGCDQLWNFLDVPHPRHTLPSGLQLVPSKLGYLLTGQQMRAPQEEQGDRTDRVDATLVNSFTNFDEELERWDKYWTMDSAGVCEFTGTENAEKDATNAKVAKFFEETIEKREDGYYIRLPYKENHPPLPTNKAIALKRLKTVLETLRRTPELLNDYDKTFRAQQEIGVIEEVENPSHTDGAIVHYIPHQPVITPQKGTTKLRIVFDASAHFKDSPSLNDVLYQGPLILPELYAMLLRFRTPKYVIISDVEKAFLQVRLHEADRDATRFLWVRDINEPFGIHNVATFRFTRVTFGLNVSPYLLGATINHHLRSAVQNEELAKEIRENLYVDNLILSAATPSEAARKSLEARKILKRWV